MFKHTKKSSSPGLFGRILRTFFTVFVLTAFVLAISLLVKTLATTSPDKYIAFARPMFARLPFAVNENKAGQVAGALVQRISETDLTPESTKSIEETTGEKSVVTVALLADSHNAFDNLTKALDITKGRNIKTAFFLGDYTDLGVVKDLELAKSTMVASGLEYFSLPGDHDLWQSVGPENFLQVFGKNYFVKVIGGFKFVGLDNSANYTLIDEARMTWFKQNLSDADFVLLSQPLYHPSFNRTMGVVNGEDVTNVKKQAQDILSLIQKSKVKAIISGDQHLSSSNVDPVRSSLKHIIIGALAKERNLQTPRFSILKVYKNGDFDLEEVVLE